MSKEIQQPNQVEETPDFTNEELQQMLIDKTQELLEVQTKLKQTEIKALAVFEENRLIKASPPIAEMKAEMDYHMSMAEKFIKGKAFKCETPEQAYVIIKAGSEMGLKPVEAMQALYIVNGAVRYYGDKMIGKLTQMGYKITYTDESKNGVTVTVSHPKTGELYVEKVTPQDDALVKSNAYKFAPKNKMRFHGVRMIASFYLPHLFMSVSDEFTSDYNMWERKETLDANENSKRLPSNTPIADQIQDCKTVEELEEVWNENKAQITRDIQLVELVGKRKKELAPNPEDNE